MSTVPDNLILAGENIEEAFDLPEVSNLVSQCGQRGLIVSGCGNAVSDTNIKKLALNLKSRRQQVHLYSGITNGCSLFQAHKICDYISENSIIIDWILAIGGGSVIDMGKLIREFLLPQSQFNIERPQSTFLPSENIQLISVPTTIGSAAEISSVISFSTSDAKISLKHKTFTPTATIIIPSLYRSLSKYQIEVGIFDAISHSLDPLLSNPDFFDVDISYTISIVKYLLLKLPTLKNIRHLKDNILISIVNATHVLATEKAGRPSSISLIHRMEHCSIHHTDLPHGAVLFHLFKAFIRLSSYNLVINKVTKEFCSVDGSANKNKDCFVGYLNSCFPELSETVLWRNQPDFHKIAKKTIKYYGKQGLIATKPPTSIHKIEEIFKNSDGSIATVEKRKNNLKPNIKRIFGGISDIHPVILITPIKPIFDSILKRCITDEQESTSGWFKIRNVFFRDLNITIIHAGPYSQPLIDCLNFLNQFEENVQRILFCGLCGVAGEPEQIGRIVLPDFCCSYAEDSRIRLGDINRRGNRKQNSCCISFDTLHQERMAILHDKSIESGTYIDLELFHVVKWAKAKRVQAFACLGVTDNVYEKPIWATDEQIPKKIIHKLAFESLIITEAISKA